MGSKISNARSFKRLLQRYKGLGGSPKYLSDHWQLFKNLFDYSSVDWSAEVIFFSKKWIIERKDPKWKMLKQYFLDVGWQTTAYLRDQLVFDLMFSHALRNYNLKPDPYLCDTVKHLCYISQGTFPGFCVSNNDQILPLSFFEKVFIEDYGIQYAPIIFCLGYLPRVKNVYYSLEYPTLAAFSPKSQNYSSKLEDLREIKHIIRALNRFLEQDDWQIQGTPIHGLLDVSYKYLHPDKDSLEETSLTSGLLQWDPRIQIATEKSGLPFATSNPLLRGSILIST